MATAAPLLALYPRTAPPRHIDIAFVGSQEENGCWSMRCNGDLLWQDSNIGNTVAALELALYRRVIANITSKLCSIHAAAICIDQQAIICAGVSGAGKSSLCTQALLAGAHYLSDEFALLATDGNIHPFPRPLQWEKLTHPAFTRETMTQSELFDRGEYQFSDPNGTTQRSQLWLPRQLQRAPVPLKMVILPRFSAECATIITPIARSSAIMQLADLIQQPGNTRHQIQMLHCRVPADCTIYSLQFGCVNDAWRAIKKLL
ncbi:MAG: hypothetical protein R8J85_07675 [Mariprofundales bacterium]